MNSYYLARIRLEAMRRHVWFRALSSLERALVDSVIRVFDRPRSPTLIHALARIVVKVKRALMSPLMRLTVEVGRALARRISMAALKWGNKGAAEWAEDEGFMRYLAVIDMNSVPGFRLSDALLSGVR